MRKIMKHVTNLDNDSSGIKKELLCLQNSLCVVYDILVIMWAYFTLHRPGSTHRELQLLLFISESIQDFWIVLVLLNFVVGTNISKQYNPGENVTMQIWY